MPVSNWQKDAVVPAAEVLRNRVAGQPWPFIETTDGHLCHLNEDGEIVGYPIYRATKDHGAHIFTDDGQVPEYGCLDDDHIQDIEEARANLRTLTATIGSGHTTKEAAA